VYAIRYAIYNAVVYYPGIAEMVVIIITHLGPAIPLPAGVVAAERVAGGGEGSEGGRE